MRTYERDQYTNLRHHATVLTLEQLNEANKIGTLRQAIAERRGSRDFAGFSGGRATNQRGARCELAAAKILGVPWNVPVSTDFARINAVNDVGGYEIRSTALPNGCLVIREKDRDEAAFVLAVEDQHPMPGFTSYRVRLVGWAFAGDAKRGEFRRAPNGHRPAWFLPQRELRPLHELPHLVRDERLVDADARGDA
jgi:hypothetical protein